MSVNHLLVSARNEYKFNFFFTVLPGDVIRRLNARGRILICLFSLRCSSAFLSLFQQCAETCLIVHLLKMLNLDSSF